MSLRDQITNDLKAAFKGGDRFVSDTLKLLKSAILYQEITVGKQKEGLDDTELESLIQREVKKRREAAELYQQSNRDDLAQKELLEAEIMQKYLPQQLSDEEIESLVNQVIEELAIERTPQNQGVIIGNVKKRAGSAAAGGRVAQIVARVINNN